MAATVEEKAIPVVVKQGWIKKKGMQIFTYFFITQEIDIEKMVQTYIALNKTEKTFNGMIAFSANVS